MNHLSVKTPISKKAIPFTALFLLLAANRCLGQAWAGTDDFSLGISPSNWAISNNYVGQMIVVGTNGHASFLVPVSTGADQNAFIGWRGTPTAAEDWVVSITGHNFAPDGSQLQLAVADKKSWDSGVVYAFHMDMVNELSGSVLRTGWWDAGSYPPYRTSVGTTSSNLFSLCFAYHAASQTIEAWYDPTASGLGWAELDSMTLSALSPYMTATNTII